MWPRERFEARNVTYETAETPKSDPPRVHKRHHVAIQIFSTAASLWQLCI
jgi:hypothetical protein